MGEINHNLDIENIPKRVIERNIYDRSIYRNYNHRHCIIRQLAVRKEYRFLLQQTIELVCMEKSSLSII